MKKIHEFMDIIESLPFNIRYMGIWYKPNGAGPSGNGLGRRFEVWFWIDGKEKRDGEWKFLPDVLVHSRITKRSKEGVLHPTQKPIALMENLIRFFTKPGDIILDPFLGSGTTMVASQNLQRSCIGIEINPIFNDMTQKRCFHRSFLDRDVSYEFTES